MIFCKYGPNIKCKVELCSSSHKKNFFKVMSTWLAFRESYYHRLLIKLYWKQMLTSLFLPVGNKWSFNGTYSVFGKFDTHWLLWFCGNFSEESVFLNKYTTVYLGNGKPSFIRLWSPSRDTFSNIALLLINEQHNLICFDIEKCTE